MDRRDENLLNKLNIEYLTSFFLGTKTWLSHVGVLSEQNEYATKKSVVTSPSPQMLRYVRLHQLLKSNFLISQTWKYDDINYKQMIEYCYFLF